MRFLRYILLLLLASSLGSLRAQFVSRGEWRQSTIVSFRASQLFYEGSVAINLRPGRKNSDFLNFSFGYGHPTKRNAWRKFMSVPAFPDDISPEVQDAVSSMQTDHLHSWLLAVGWRRYFNHFVGLYGQVGWACITDLSSSMEYREIFDGLGVERNTFIYNSVPVEIGISLNLWSHLVVEAGVTYMWKEIPLLTGGIGYAF